MFSTHAIISAALKTPEIALSEPEAKTLAKATAEVAKYYPMAIDGKTIAWINLATCIGLTYGSRAYLIGKRLDKERKEPKQARRPQAGAQEQPQPTSANDPDFSFGGIPGYLGPTPEAGSF